MAKEGGHFNIVTWTLPGNLPHIGIVSNRVGPASGRWMIVHNIGAGPRLEDMLFDYPVTGRDGTVAGLPCFAVPAGRFIRLKK